MKSFVWALLAARVAAQVPLIAFGTVELPLTGAHNSAVSSAEVELVLNSVVGHGDTHVFVVDEVCYLVVCVFLLQYPYCFSTLVQLSSDAFSAITSQAAFTHSIGVISSRVAVSPSALLAPRAAAFRTGATKDAALAQKCEFVPVRDDDASRAAYLVSRGRRLSLQPLMQNTL